MFCNDYTIIPFDEWFNYLLIKVSRPVCGELGVPAVHSRTLEMVCNSKMVINQHIKGSCGYPFLVPLLLSLHVIIVFI